MEYFYGSVDNLFLWILFAPLLIGFIALMFYREKDNG